MAGEGATSVGGAAAQRGNLVSGTRGGFDVGLNRSFDVGRGQHNFEPLDFPGLQVWYHAGNVDASGGLLVSWPDSSGNGVSAMQTVSTQRAVCGASSQNGFPVIANDGANDNYGWTSTITLTNWDILIVAKAVADSVVIGNSGVNIQGARILGASNQIRSFDGVQHVTSDALPSPTSGFTVLEWTRQAGVIQFFQNAFAVGGTVDFGSPAATMAVNNLWNLNGTPAGAASVLELLVFNRKLSVGERSEIVIYLRDKYAI
jgi:hypothetical protein